jgi:hypothetical protein
MLYFTLYSLPFSLLSHVPELPDQEMADRLSVSSDYHRGRAETDIYV